jgi:large subunit ribosomal protein L21
MSDPQDRPDAIDPVPPAAEGAAPGDEPLVAAAGATTSEAPLDETGAATAADAPQSLIVEASAPAEVVDEVVAVPVEGGKRPSARASRQTPPTPKPLSPYAVIETGGKQYRVSVGDTVSVERLAIEAGADLTIDRVLLLGGDGSTRVGTPTVSGAAVTARVDDHLRGEKIVVFKYKAKKRYRRRLGHRQELTRLTITGISG